MVQGARYRYGSRVPGSLGSRPSPYVRVLIARGWAKARFPLRARFNCAGVGKSKLGMIRHVRRRSVVQYSRTVPRARPVVQAWHVIFLTSGFFDSLFLADSGGEEQDDWLLG